MVQKANAGGTNDLYVENTDNGFGSSQARLMAVVGGTTAGDPFTRYNIPGGTDWSSGADNSDADKYKVSNSANLGSNDYLTITTAGAVTVGGVAGTGTQTFTVAGNRAVVITGGTTNSAQLSLISSGTIEWDMTATTGSGALVFTAGGTDWLRLTSTGDLSMAATSKLRFDGVGGGGDTYIYESQADRLVGVVGGVSILSMDTTGAWIPATKKLYVDGGGDTYFSESSANVLSIVVGGTERKQINATGYSKVSNSGTYLSATGSFHEINQSTDAAQIILQLRHTAATATNQFGMEIFLSGNATERATIRSNGGSPTSARTTSTCRTGRRRTSRACPARSGRSSGRSRSKPAATSAARTTI
jgi:hypothetical protein